MIASYSMPITLSTAQWTPNNSMTALGASYGIQIDGLLFATWDGTDQYGNPVDNGCYAAHILFTDVSGVFQEQYIPITVNRQVSRTYINIFDASNNKMKSLYRNWANPAPSNSFSDMSLSTASFQAGYCQTAGTLPIQVAIDSTNGFSCIWDGRNDAGTLVPSGTYSIRLCNSNDLSVNNFSASVDVTSLGQATAAISITASPNPANAGDLVNVHAIAVCALTLNLTVYDSGGNLVNSVSGATGTNQTTLDTTGFSPGTYQVLVAVYDSEGFTGTQALSLVVN
jgi:hypothetical protein